MKYKLLYENYVFFPPVILEAHSCRGAWTGTASYISQDFPNSVVDTMYGQQQVQSEKIGAKVCLKQFQTAK